MIPTCDVDALLTKLYFFSWDQLIMPQLELVFFFKFSKIQNLSLFRGSQIVKENSTQWSGQMIFFWFLKSF